MLERTWYTNLATTSAFLMAHLPRLNWAGFYLAQNLAQNLEPGLEPNLRPNLRPNIRQDFRLKLGPFQGLPACLSIDFGRGVCGTAAKERRTVMVDDVHAFPGHITCDARSRSEIVIPLINQADNRLLGVLDLDSPETSRFEEADREGLESLIKILIEATQWPPTFY